MFDASRRHAPVGRLTEGGAAATVRNVTEGGGPRLVPEQEPGKEMPVATQYKEAYDPEDQAMIEASRLRRAAKGQ